MKKVILGLLIGISFVSGGDLECANAMLDSDKAYSKFSKNLIGEKLELAKYYLDAYKASITRFEIECKNEFDQADYDRLIKDKYIIVHGLEESLRMDIQDKIRALEVDKILRKNHPEWYKWFIEAVNFGNFGLI